jgi:putative ABC transport system permease protein
MGAAVDGAFQSARREREMADEIESHLQIHTDENIRRGMAPDAARRAAILQLGSPASLKERFREQGGVPLVEHFVQDLRYAGRTLRRSPGFTMVAVLTVAFGVAGPTITFSMLKAWILDPLPFAQPDALVDVRSVETTSGDTGSVNPADFLDFTRGVESFEALAAYRQNDVRVTGGDRPERLRGAQVTVNFFDLLGTPAAMGRVFQEADARAGDPRLAVLSYSTWRERFAGDPTIVGRTIQVNGEDHAVIGVLSETFQFTLLGRVELWRPYLFTPAIAANRAPWSLKGVGRLRPSRTMEQARGEITRIARELAEKYPETNGRRGARVIGLAEEIRLHHDAGFLVPVLFAMVFLVLLVACVNVTNVMLARTSTRRQEMAVRLALGASRARIVRQWLVEHVLLFVVASAMGAGLAVYGTAWVTASIPVENRQYLRNNAVLSVDGVVLFFALAVGVLSGVVFGWLPAWTSAKTDVNVDLRDSSRSSTSTTGTKLRRILVIAEMSLALALLIGAGLLVQTARNIRSVDIGFDPHQLLTFRLSLDRERYQEPHAIRAFYDRLVDDLRGRPGVASVGGGSYVPFGNIGEGTEFFIDGEPDPVPAKTPIAAFNHITPEYARTMGLRLAHGRLIGEDDPADGEKAAMINRTLAERHFSGRDPIGRRLRLERTSNDRWTIVGIVDDVKNGEMLDPPEPQLYVPFAQQPNRSMMVVIRTTGDPQALAGTVRGAVAALDPAEPVAHLFTMESLIGRITGPYDTISTFVTFFGLLTLLLTGVGVYGVVSHTFAQRTREIGIRVALGARGADVALLVLKQIRFFVLVGLLPGLALAWLLGHAMQGILVGVAPADWRLYAAMSILLTLVALLAASVPARRASTIDPVTALRHD